jgi:GNAT superfamily N-acetyltransferase
LLIRKAQIEDSAGIARVQVDSYRTAYAGIFPQSYLDRFTYEEQEQDWRDLLTSEARDVLYVAEADAGEIVGYALGRPGMTGIPAYNSELVALHVRRTHQGQGIGRRLVGTIAEQLKRVGCTSLMLWVLEENPSRLFYEQLGGELLPERQVTHGAVEAAYGWAHIESLCA